MSKTKNGITVQIMGRDYQIACPDEEIDSLRRAARYLEEQMVYARDVGKVLSIDRIAVIAALNIAHQFINLERNNSNNMQTLQQRLIDLQGKVEVALSQHAQLELASAE